MNCEHWYFAGYLVWTKGQHAPGFWLAHFWFFQLPSRIGVRTAPATSTLCFSSLQPMRRILHPMPSRNSGRRRKNSWLVGSWIQVFRWNWVGEGSACWHLCPKICKLRPAAVKPFGFVVREFSFWIGVGLLSLVTDVFQCQLIYIHIYIYIIIYIYIYVCVCVCVFFFKC